MTGMEVKPNTEGVLRKVFRKLFHKCFHKRFLECERLTKMNADLIADITILKDELINQRNANELLRDNLKRERIMRAQDCEWIVTLEETIVSLGENFEKRISDFKTAMVTATAKTAQAVADVEAAIGTVAEIMPPKSSYA
jgi:hypothetical protein